MQKTLTADFFEEHFDNYNPQKTTAQKTKIYNWLNHDNLNDIVIDGEVFWVELTTSRAIMPDHIFNYIEKWAKKRGYKYLYAV